MGEVDEERGLRYILVRNIEGHDRTINTVKFSPNGQWLMTASDDYTIKMWDFATGGSMKNTLSHELAVNEIDWSSDNSLLVSASDDETVKIWDIQRGKLLTNLTGHTDFVTSCKFNEQRTLVASASFDRTIKVWDRRTGNVIMESPEQKFPLSCVTFNKEGNRIGFSDMDGLCKIWELASGKHVLAISMNEASVTNMMYLPDNKWLLAAATNNTIKLWNTQYYGLKIYRGHINELRRIRVDYSANFAGSRYVVSGSEDKLIYIWNMESQAIEQVLPGHTSTVMSVACHPTKEIIASTALERDGPYEFPIKIWKNI